MANVTVEIALGIQAEFIIGPLMTAQDAVLAEYKAAGNDLGALATGEATGSFYISRREGGVQSGRRRRSGDPSRLH